MVDHLSQLVASGQLYDAVHWFAKASRQLRLVHVPPAIWESFVSACAMCADARTADAVVDLLTPYLSVRDPAALERIRVGAINAHRRAGNLHKVRELADLLPSHTLRSFDVRVRAAATADEALRVLAEVRSTPGVVLDARFYVSLIEKCRFDADAGEFIWRLAHSERGLWSNRAMDREAVLCARIVSLATLAEPQFTEELIELWTELADLRPELTAADVAAPPDGDANARFASNSRLSSWSSHRKSAYLVTNSFCSRVTHNKLPQLLRLSRGAVSTLLSPDVDVFQATVLQTIRLFVDPLAAPTQPERLINTLLSKIPAPTEHTRAPDRVLLNCVVNLLTRARRMDDAEAFVDTIFPRYGYSADATTLSTLLRGWVDAGDVNEALRVFERMASMGVERSPYVFVQLYRAAGSVQLSRTGEDLYERIERWRDGSFGSNMSVLNSRLNVLLRLGRYSDGDALVADMRSRGLVPDRYTFNTMLHGVAQQHKVLSAAQPPNLAVIAELDKRVRVILTDMSNSGRDPDISTYTILISMSRNPAQCRAMYDRMLVQGLTPDGLLLVGLVNAALRADQFSIEFTEFVLNECRQRNVRPDRPQLRLLMQRSLRANATEFAMAMLDNFEEIGWLEMKDEGSTMLAFVSKCLEQYDEIGALRLIHERFPHAILEHMMVQLFCDHLRNEHNVHPPDSVLDALKVRVRIREGHEEDEN
jgi:pentatricopeptide repeat protein